jgi:excisionase family DNA binding protein
MSTHYRDSGFAYYECSSKTDQMNTSKCRSITADTVDNAVAERLLDSLNPQEVGLALAAADEVADRRDRRNRAAELAVERARYEAERAERAFHACEPDNRLVARNLESRWEARLVALAEAEKALTQAQTATPPLPSRAELEALTGDVVSLWHAPSTSPRDRKRLLRTLIADVSLLPEPDVGKARIGIRWHTGATDEIVVARYQKVKQWGHTEPAAVEMVRSLAQLSNREIAERLDQAGHTTGAGRPFRCREVANLRIYHDIPSAASLHDGTLPASQVAKRLGVCPHTIINWINKGWLVGHRGLDNRWHVPFSPKVESACRERIAQSTQIRRPDTAEPQKTHEYTVRQLATQLGVSVDVVYYWIKHRHILARRGHGGGWLINFDATTEAECRRRIATSPQIKIKAVGNKSKTSQSTTKEAV